MPKPLPWSYSSLDDFTNCPKAFYEKRIIKSVREEESDAMIWGSIVHKHFEDYQKEEKPLPEELAVHQGFMDKLKAAPGEFYTERKIALNVSREPCGFFDKKVWFRGIIDYAKIDGDSARLIDYKTGKPHSKFQQLTLFALYTFIERPEVDKIRVDFYWTKTQSTTGQTFTRDMIPEMWDKFVPQLTQYVTAFREDVWHPRPSGLCNGWCPVTSCEYWKPRRR